MSCYQSTQDSTEVIGEQQTARNLLAIIEDIRTVFDTHFDKSWFAILIDDLPIDKRTLREIRTLVSLRFIQPGDELLIREGVRELEQFIALVRQFLLPVIRDKLGITGFPDRKKELDKQQLILRQFVFYTFPHNLNRLEELTRELKASAGLYY